tara:strand:- start:727 stop:1038 length:312 start_codon:yes stop_codon:yes gene_type:complete
MARPKPMILMEFTDPKNYRSEQILAADAIYAVFHENKPINLRSLNSLVNFPGPKYKKVSFSNSGHAFNLATRLNKLFKTDKFQVMKFTKGEVIVENNGEQGMV